MVKNIISIIMLLITQASYAQWEKREIVPSSYSDSVLPIWADVDEDKLQDLIGYDLDLEVLFYRKRGSDGFLANIVIDEVSLRNGKFLVSDWDKDGDTDIISMLGSSFGFVIDARIYFNDGKGNFTPEDIQFDIDQYFGELSAIADMDGDGLSELLIEHSNDHYLYTYNGSNLVAIPANVGTTNSFGTDANFIKLDGDKAGLVDSYINEVKIYNYINGELILKQEINVPVSGLGNASTFENMRFHDLDGDGDVDLCRKIQDGRLAITGDVSSYTPGTARFFEFIQNDQGVFMANMFFQSIDKAIIHATPYQLVNEKIYAYAIYDEGLKIFHFQNETFQQNEQYAEVYPINRPEVTDAINISTMNDGQPFAFQFVDSKYRLAIATLSDDQDIKFEWNTCANCSLLFDYNEIKLSDLDNDGDEDILVCSPRNTSELFWIKNYLSGCRLDTIVPILTNYYSDSDITLQVETGDLDNDGDNDIVLMEDIIDNRISVLYNLGKGSFSNPELLTVDIKNGFELYVEDIQNDGYAEIIIHTGLFSTINQNTNTFAVTILDNSSGMENYELKMIQNSSQRGQLEFGDMNNDGTTDLIVYNDDPFNETVNIYTNDNGELSEVQVYSEFIDMFGMDLFDYDNDGFLDILAFHDDISNNNISTLYLYKNENGIVNFTNPIFIYDELERCTFEAIKNEDGTNQLVGTTINPFISTLLLYDESKPLDTLDTRPQVDFLVGDINGDGFTDILSGNINGGLNFYTRGEIDCGEVEECISDTKGAVVEMDCNGTLSFLVETEDGILLEPQFNAGEDFNLSTVEKVIFNYTELNESPMCSDALSVLIKCIKEDETSSNRELSEKRFSVYPNPVSGVLNLATEEEGTFFLYNMAGQLIREIESFNSAIDISDLNAGTYFIYFRNDQYSEIQQVIKL